MVRPATLRDRSSSVTALVLRMSASVWALIEKGTFWIVSDRLVAVTITSSTGVAVSVRRFRRGRHRRRTEQGADGRRAQQYGPDRDAKGWLSLHVSSSQRLQCLAA